MYCPSSESKGVDQLRGYREADSAPLVSHMQIVGFSMRRLNFVDQVSTFFQNKRLEKGTIWSLKFEVLCVHILKVIIMAYV